MKRSRFPFCVCLAALVFLYLPIVVLVVNSFNASRFGGVWGGFSLKWYRLLFTQADVWLALRNSLLISATASVAAMALGTLAAFALHRYRTRLQAVHYTLVYTPLVMPDVLMGIGLLLFFAALRVPLGLGTIFLAHVTFCVSYVAMVVLARLQDFDFSLVEAAQDLGAGPWTIARRVLLPLLAPGILAGGLLAFSLSIDDFVITFFVSGPGSTTLPVKIYSMIKYGKPPMINALSALILCVTFLTIWASQRLREQRT
jgi:spermidine/putrescine transport system permease protein